MQEPLTALFLLLLVLLGAAGYFLPAIVAAARKHPQAGAILLLNLVAGWTFFGWVAALVWSALAFAPPAPPAAAPPRAPRTDDDEVPVYEIPPTTKRRK